MDCLFCNIASGKIPAKLLYESDTIVAFHDIAPQAPQHVLIIPRRHIATMNELTEKDGKLMGDMMLVAKKIAQDTDISENGYRVLMNCNSNGGQAVYHIHLHLLGGRQMAWPPG